MKAFRLLLIAGLGFLVTLWLAGCVDLAVPNENQPDRERALAQPKDVESLIAGSFLTWWSGTQKDVSFPGTTLSTMADAHTSSWGNWGMQDMSSEPRAAYDNSPSYRYSVVNEGTWYNNYRAISSVNDGLTQIKAGLKIVDDAGVDNTPRAKAFAKFVQGIAHGWLGCFFDKAFIVDENINLETDKLEFKPYKEVIDAALKMLEECIAISDQNTFKLPITWMNGLELTNVQLKELAYSFMARYRAGVARTPQDRAGVNWGRVISDAQKGVKQDFAPIGDGNFWWDGLKFRGQHQSWMRADYKTVGQTDKSGNYQTWLNTPVANRQPFDITTDDRRITGAGGPKTAGVDFAYRSPSPFRADRGTYHHSFYFHQRYAYHLTGGATGPMVHTTVTEMKHLIAEGLLRTGASKQTVVDIINETRVNRGKLAPVTTSLSNDDLFKWLKYEKMIETFATAAGIPWFDRRGWTGSDLVRNGPGAEPGPTELPAGTLIHFPVPGKELEVLQREIYTLGGVGQAGGAPKIDVGHWWMPLKSVSMQ